MNLPFVALVVGAVLVIESGLMAFCGIFSWLRGGPEEQVLLTAWLAATFITFTVGVLPVVMFRKAMDHPVFRREAFAVVGLGWILAGVCGALPFVLAPAPLTMAPWDGLFEAYSGLTTTGATVITDLTVYPDSLILWRSLTQWLGGLGIVVLFVAVLGLFGGSGKSLFTSETSAVADDDNIGARVRSLAINYSIIYVVVTGIGVAGLWLLGMDLFDAVNHCMCAISTGGFSPYNESIGAFPGLGVQVWLIVIMVFGGIAFPIHYQFYVLRRLGVLRDNTELQAYLLILAVVSAIVLTDLLSSGFYGLGNWLQATVASLFQVTSIMTTTGFASEDFNRWPNLAKTLLLGVMIIGGMAGSTAGGLKVARVVLFSKTMGRQFRTIFRPHLVLKLRMNGRVVDEKLVEGVVFYVAMYFGIMITGTLVTGILEPHLSLTTVLSATMATFNNIGPGLELVGPSANYNFFNPAAKLWLSLLMLLGRLEIFALVVLFVPSFWRKF